MRKYYRAAALLHDAFRKPHRQKVSLKPKNKAKTSRFLSTLRFLFGGGRWIRTTEVRDNRFTVCPLWPLGNSPVFYYIFQSKKALNGAGEGNRTPNLLITNQLLCQLSYTSISAVLYHAALRFFLPSVLRRMILYHFAVLLSIPFCDFFRTFEKSFYAPDFLYFRFIESVPERMCFALSRDFCLI